MIATPDVLYLADDQSCKRIDARSGQLLGEIVIPDGVADGKVWKWMALEAAPGGHDVLYALVGGEEIRPKTVRSEVQGLGHWPWGMWEGHEYRDPKTNFGFGRTFVAIDPKSHKLLWRHHEDDYLDGRGVCMKGGRIYYYCPEKFLACLDACDGQVLWKRSDPDLLRAIGRTGRAQNPREGYSTLAMFPPPKPGEAARPVARKFEFGRPAGPPRRADLAVAPGPPVQRLRGRTRRGGCRRTAWRRRTTEVVHRGDPSCRRGRLVARRTARAPGARRRGHQRRGTRLRLARRWPPGVLRHERLGKAVTPDATGGAAPA